MSDSKLKDVSEHFSFGKNWASYAELINKERIDAAKKQLARLAGPEELQAKSFIDIGCGSGLHSLAAARLGVSRILAVDIDPDSVATTTKTLTEYEPGVPWECKQVSVFDLSPENEGTFDVVYSWGVLHHTGAMYEAVEKASRMVAPGGIFIIALYRKTSFCGMWKVIKRVYAKSPLWGQALIRSIYIFSFRLGLIVKGQHKDFITSYGKKRGMELSHDVHDWLGGWPYESITPQQARELLNSLQLESVREFTTKQGLVSQIFGSGNDEYVYRKIG